MPSWLKIAIGLVYMAIATTLHAVVLLLLFPSRNLRIRSCNYWGWVSGPFVMALSGCPVTVEGREHLDGARPAIYISNHTSTLDIFLGIGFGPAGTVGIAKKEVVYYPFFGQLYWLSGHLRIDRGNRERAVQAMKDLAETVRRYRLSIWMWPEGTRSRDGRLLPFKKGLWHLAIQTGLPVVPVVVQGAHKSWAKGGLAIQEVPIHVSILPAIDTSAWAERDSQEVVDELHALFAEVLPAEQRSLEAAA